MINFSASSIRNPLVAILLFCLLTIAGFLGFSKMKVQQFPDMDFPVVVVTVTLPGAAPQQLENEVSKKVENKLAGLNGIKHINSTLQTGAATIVTEFVLDKDLQEALDETRSAMNEIRGDLPAAANAPIVSKVSVSDSPILTYTIAADNMDAMELSWFVSNVVDKRLSDIKGVGQVSRIGGINRIVTVAANPERLNALQMPISQLSEQIAANQMDSTGGEAKIGNRTQTIRVLGAVENARELNDLQISLPTGGTEPLSNLATVIDGPAEASSIAKLDGKTVVAFNVNRTRGASEVKVANAVQASLEELQKEMPNIKIEKVFDMASYIEEDYEASINMLVEGGILAVIVVFLFLFNWRATIVAAVALPLSVIPTFFFMWLFGFSLNVISLLALSLVIGVLVDDAIVEIENIVRHLRMGKTPYEAAMEAADEIGLAVIATTFTLIAVFLPTAFMSGIVGKFFKQFGWTASIAIFMSLLVARLITPMMAAYLMKPEPEQEEKQGTVMHMYLNTVHWMLHNRWITLFGVIILFIASLGIVGKLQTTFIPADNNDQSRVSIELTPDATLEDTTRISEMVRERVIKIDGVESVMSAIGKPQAVMSDNNTGTGQSTNMASLDLILSPRGERLDKAELEKHIIAALADVPGARFTVGISNSGGTGYSFQVTSSNANLLEQTVQKIMDEIRQLNEVSEVTSNRSLAVPELSITPDRVAMADRGVTTQSIADTLRIATTGDYEQRLSKLNLDTRQLPIVVRIPDAAKADIDQLGELFVPSINPNGQGVRIRDVATLSFDNGPAEVRRFDRERSISITVQSRTGELGGLVQAVKNTPTLSNLPSEISIIDQGDAENMKELFTGFVIAMSVGIFCIFGVLILLFNKILQPFTILMALPLSIGGAFVGLLLTNSSLSMPSMIGFIMLMGIATKNSILLVDYAIIAQREHGKNRLDALIDACKKRARPIIMTTIAMGAGMMPILLGLGGADTSFRQPMAAAVLGGLVTSTFLSLIVIPVVYSLMEDLSGVCRSLFGMKKQ